MLANLMPPVAVAVVADLEPGGWWATSHGDVLAALLEARLDGAVVSTYACRPPRQLTPRRDRWRPLAELVHVGTQVAIAFGEQARSALGEVTPQLPVVTAPSIDDDFAPGHLVADIADPVALDVRRRMLRHLGVVPAEPYVLDEEMLERLDEAFPLTPLDVWLVASEASEIACADYRISGLLARAGTRDVASVVDRIAESVMVELAGEAGPASVAMQGAVTELRRRNDALAAELRDAEQTIARLREAAT